MNTALRLLQLISTALSFVVISNAQDVSTGPAPIQQSTQPSKYMRGIDQENHDPSTLRIIGAHRSAVGVIVEAILLDSNGNALGANDENGSWSMKVGCKTQPLGGPIVPTVAQLTWRSSSPADRYSVLIDHSLTSLNMASEILRGLRDLLPGIPGQDSIAVATYDHTSLEVSSLAPLQIAAERCGSTLLAPPGGIASTFTAMMSGMRVFDGKPAEHNTLIVVTASNDMASLTYNSADVRKKAEDRGVSIVVIKVGNTSQGYINRYLATATGGMMYSISTEDVPSVASIIREVIYGKKHHVEAFADFRNTTDSCNDLLIALSWSNESGIIRSDTTMLPLQPRSFSITSATVAVFEDTTDRGLQQYYPVLAIIGEDLMANPAKRIRLTGNVSTDVAGNALERGLERAQHVAGFLQAYGVKPEQIDVLSNGSSKPLYYLQLDGTQRLLNNRVEASYASANDEPYSILVERLASELLAAGAVDRWNERGYKAYFEPAVVDRKPVYDVVLWGYRTKVDAEKAGKGLKKFGVKEYIVQ